MRQPQPFVITSTSKSAQQGFSLFIVLMVMIVVAFLVVSVTQSYNTEQRISTNDADHKYAMALAEAALRTGEGRIASKEFETTVTFTPTCDKSLCSSAGAAAGTFGNIIVQAETGRKAAWERLGCKSSGKLCIDEAGTPLKKPGTAKGEAPRYIIEYVSTGDEGVIYRVTAKAWGRNANTTVVLQSYVSAS